MVDGEEKIEKASSKGPKGAKTGESTKDKKNLKFGKWPLSFSCFPKFQQVL
jgi:hypothetical protein